MSFALLQNSLLLPVELMLNAVLALDAASKPRLQRIDGNTLAVHMTQPALTVYVIVRGGRLQLAAIHEGSETASLRGSATALLGLLLRREPVDSLHAHGIELRGDTAFVQQLQTILQDLDVDWEYQLSRFFGDIPTQTFADGLRGARAQLRNTGARVRDNVDEYLHEESGLLPDANSLEAFYRDIGELKLRAERLEARIARLSPPSQQPE
ncbi:MAG TPA: SCP2 sterol-binding domain-containing protein [Pseudomonadales bacterium]